MMSLKNISKVGKDNAPFLPSSQSLFLGRSLLYGVSGDAIFPLSQGEPRFAI